LEDADLIIVNTCGFIGDAKQESIDTILEVAQLKEKKLKKLIVAGCLAQRYAAELMEELPEVDAIIGTGDIDKIEAVVDDIFREKRVIRSDSLEFLANAATERILTTHPHTAYLKIAEGCDRKCTYYIIPKLRGKLRSRSIEDIVEEAKKLSAMGVRELNLLAQETSEYGIDRYGDKSLARLLRELVKVEGIKWIRNYYMFPNSVTDELIETIRDEEKVCSYFDISIQHVASNVLQAMKRAKDSTQIKGVLAKIRKEIPDASIRTTVIVGFPGETEEDFIELKEFIEEFKFDYVGVFKYSREEDTEAHDLFNQVDDETKKEDMLNLLIYKVK
jgi:RNA modification enzyme, MiaB family